MYDARGWGEKTPVIGLTHSSVIGYFKFFNFIFSRNAKFHVNIYDIL